MKLLDMNSSTGPVGAAPTVGGTQAPMQFLMIVDNPEIGRFVSANGVARLFIDLEYMGKEERQKGLGTWKSNHRPADVSRMREAAPDAHLLVRVNPLHDASQQEIDDVIARGADSVMLPMFRDAADVARFLEFVDGRAEPVPLVETATALAALPEIAETLPLTRLHIGLNDLHLDMGLDFMFQPIADGLLEEPTAALRKAGIRFGIGGIARAGEGAVSPEFLLGEHVRLGSDAAILSRTLHRSVSTLAALRASMDLPAELRKLQAIYARFLLSSADELERNRDQAADLINGIAQDLRTKKGKQT